VKTWLHKHRRFLLASVTFWLLILTLWGFYLLFGRSMLFGDPLTLHSRPAAGTLIQQMREIDCRIRIFLTALAMGYTLVTLVYAFHSKAWRKRYALLVFMACYLGFEGLACPRLSVFFGLENYYAVKNPDHLPSVRDETQTGKGKPWRRTGWNSDALRCDWESSTFTEEGLNIIFLGDSFTFGYGLYPDQSFPKKVEGILTDQFPGCGVRVANFGWEALRRC